MTIVESILNGEHDQDLRSINAAVRTRFKHVQAVKAVQNAVSLKVGDRVRLSDDMSPKYLQRAKGTVKSVSGTTVTITLDYPVGRFQSGIVSIAADAVLKM